MSLRFGWLMAVATLLGSGCYFIIPPTVRHKLKDLSVVANVSFDARARQVTVEIKPTDLSTCPTLQQDATLTLDGTALTVVTLGNNDDAGCTAFPTFRSLAGLSVPTAATSVLVLSDASASRTMEVSHLLAETRISIVEPVDSTLRTGQSVHLAVDATMLQPYTSTVVRAFSPGNDAAPTANGEFLILSRPEVSIVNDVVIFSMPPIPAWAVGAGILTLEGSGAVPITRCDFAQCSALFSGALSNEVPVSFQ